MVESSKEAVSLYFHIPFCTKKCDYCHFYVVPDKAAYHELLLEGISLDLAQWKTQLEGKQVVSIYFGGGTPALLSADELDDILANVQQQVPLNLAQTEITIEANPETISLQKMREFASIGINRVSIGVQTLDDPLLIKLGRTHRSSAAIAAIESTVAAGISNISIDLMYDIPMQTLGSWESTLKQIQQLPITHLSLYNLTIEPHTVFFKYREAISQEVPAAETSAQMYEMAIEALAVAGLIQYEISAFARHGLYSRHNTGYWTGRPFLGFGPSAFSYWNKERFRAIAHLQKYVTALREGRSPIDFSERLPDDAQRRELFVIALRLCSGVHLQEFESKYGLLDAVTKEGIQDLKRQQLLLQENDHVTLSQKGMLFYDTVAAELI